MITSAVGQFSYPPQHTGQGWAQEYVSWPAPQMALWALPRAQAERLVSSDTPCQRWTSRAGTGLGHTGVLSTVARPLLSLSSLCWAPPHSLAPPSHPQLHPEPAAPRGSHHPHAWHQAPPRPSQGRAHTGCPGPQGLAPSTILLVHLGTHLKHHLLQEVLS